MICSNNSFHSGQSLVYLDKFFYNNTEKASPLLTALTTTPETFTQQLTTGSNSCAASFPGSRDISCCNCNCCCDIPIGPGTVFNVDNAFVIVHSYDLSLPDSITAADITIDGLPITAVTASNGRYLGDISGIVSEITKCHCKSPCADRCPGNFVMVTADGPWELLSTIVVEGTVSSGGTSCPFKMCLSPTEGEPLPVTGASTFAFCGAEIPCQKNNAAASLVISFDACASLLSPVITVTGTADAPIITLTGSLVVTPQATLQTIRPTLFNLSAYEIDAPCDDVGQCNPCNPYESQCFEITDNCCEGSSATPVRTAASASPASAAPTGACQCCETNGYGFF